MRGRRRPDDIEQLATQTGMATSTVRMYQTRACCPRRNAEAEPATTGRITRRVRMIADLQEQGFSLASVKRLTSRITEIPLT